jgi:dTDP-4-dehydrorhamnose reductase
MKVVVLGAGGMLGHKMVQRLSAQFETVGTLRHSLEHPAAAYCLKNAKLVIGVSVEDINIIKDLFDQEQPDVVINCIAITKQLKELKDPLPILKINAVFPQLLAKMCTERNIRFIHFSTDCIFHGEQGYYCEKDIPNCNELYGMSKLLGETGYPNALIIRTSIIGRELHQGTSLVEWLLSQKGGQIKGYTGALYTGFTTNAMTDIVANLILNYPSLEGIWHVSSDPISKYELLQTINQVYDLGIQIEREDHFKCDRRLDSTAFRQLTQFKPLSWQEMIKEMHADPTPYASLKESATV